MRPVHAEGLLKKMNDIGYFGLRKHIFVNELKQMLQQIRQLSLFIIAFLGTAIPALLFISLLAFGVILNNDSSTTQLLLIVWALIMMQSMLLLLAKTAILGSRYRYYLANLERGLVKRFVADSILALICNPIMLLYVFVLASISAEYWQEIPHGFLLLLLLFVGNVMCLYKPQGLYWFLGFALCSIPLLASQSLVLGLFVFCTIQLLTMFWFMARKSMFSWFSLSLPIEWMFWLSLCLGSHAGAYQTSGSGQKSNTVLSVCAIATLLIIMTYYCALNLPQYILTIHFIGAQLIVLTGASLQISIHKIINTYPLFFSSYLSNPAIAKGQYWVSIATSFTLLFLASVALNSFIIVFHLLSSLFCIYCAKRWPKFFIFSWLISGGLLGIFVFSMF